MENLSQTIAELCDMLWTQTLQLPLSPADAGDVVRGATVEGCVHICGEWNGVVVLDCAPEFAALAAQRMFHLGDQSPTRADMQDAVGELTNIIGGNLKGVISNGGCRLSLPTVVDGADFTVQVPGTRQVSREAFMCETTRIVVTVLEAVAAA